MRNFRIIAAALAAFALLSISSYAQPKGNWKERMMSEKIAFITIQLSLTPEEAQVFWPVYNQIEQKKHESQKAVMASYKALVESMKSETATDKEIDRLLDDYITAKRSNEEFSKDEVAKYRKVLPSKKVAKLYIAEEKFRRQQIRNMKGGQHGHGGAPKPGGKPDAHRQPQANK